LTAAQPPGHALAEASGPPGLEGSNVSSPEVGLAAVEAGGKVREGSVGGSLAMSPNPGHKPMHDPVGSECVNG
ncbi:Hypothetical predicted protein, partial [Marmota monax]